MSRGNNQITTLYTNLVAGSSALTPEMQERIFSHAKLTKNVALAAALAKRVDTIETIDKKLAKWDAAKIQAAWYLRPGRPVAQITEQLEREDRITVLEVLAGIEHLDAAVYEMCAKKNVSRIALPILSNPSTSREHRMVAARTLAESYDSMSYERRAKMRDLLSGADNDTVAAYVTATNDAALIKNAIEHRNGVNETTAIRVCEVVNVTLAEAKLEWKSTPVSANAQRYSWESARYVKLVDLSVELLQILQRYEQLEVSGWKEAIEALKDLHASISKRKKRSNDEDNVLNTITGILESLGVNDGTRAGIALRIKNTTDPKELFETITRLDREDKLDNQTMIAAITNPHIDLAGALHIGGQLRWHGLDVEAFLTSRKDTLSANVLGAVMVATWMQDDAQIEKLVGVHSAKDIWRACVTAALQETQQVPPYLFESKHASVDVIPQLPFAVFAQSDLPDWLVSGMATYLAANLERPEHWDGFEALAKGHVGTVEQLVRGSKLATRRTVKTEN